MNVYFLSSLVLLWSLAYPVWADPKLDLSSPPLEIISEQEAKEGELLEAEGPIEIAEFEEPQSGGIGLWSAKRIGMPYDLWRKIAEKDVLKLLPQLAQEMKSPAIRNLVMRLLVMETARSDFSEVVLMARVNALLKMGQAQLAVKMLEAVPDTLVSEALAKQRYILKVIAGESRKSVCKEANDEQNSQPEAFWQRFQVLCQALEGEADKAQLGLELLREQNNAPELFANIIQLVVNKVALEKDIKEMQREELAWLLLTEKTTEIPTETIEALSSEQLALIALNGKPKGNWKERAKALEINAKRVKSPSDNTPTIPLSLLRLKKEATMAEQRKALLALTMRRAWDKPVSVEVEDDLLSRSYRGELSELSQLWREGTIKMHDNEQRLAALLLLLRPLVEPLHYYTASDLSFLVRELKALGFANDAVAVAEEALSGE